MIERRNAMKKLIILLCALLIVLVAGNGSVAISDLITIISPESYRVQLLDVGSLYYVERM